MFRHKMTPAGPSRPVGPVNARQDVYMRVLRSFLDEGPPVVPPPQSPTTVGPMAPPPVNAPGAAYAGLFVGGEGSARSTSTGAPNFSVNIPGLGVVNRQQMEAARARAQAVIQEAIGSANLSHPTPADVEAVHTRLEEMRAGGRLTDEQFTALSDGLAVLSGATPG